MKVKGKHLVFSSQGPDTRYKKRDYRIPMDRMEEYIEALQNNFSLYQDKKKKGEKGILMGEKKMMIYLDGLYEGVCLFDHYHPIKKMEQMKALIEEFRRIKQTNDTSLPKSPKQ